MAHVIDIWRLIASADERSEALRRPASESELAFAEEGDEALIEIGRQFPGLSPELARYLSR
jgi:hypothetical protein